MSAASSTHLLWSPAHPRNAVHVEGWTIVALGTLILYCIPPHAVPLKVNYHVWDFVPVWKWGEKFSDLRGYGMTKRTGLKGTLKILGSPHPGRDKIFIFILWLTHNLHGPLPTWKRRKITQNRFSILCEVSEKIGPQTRSPWPHSTCLLYLSTLLLPHRRAHAPRDREGPAGSRWTTEQRPRGS